MPKGKSQGARVRVYPTGSHYIPGVAAVERLVSADVAEVLLAQQPPAFTTRRPEGQDAPSEDVPEHEDDILREMPEFQARREPVTTENESTAEGDKPNA